MIGIYKITNKINSKMYIGQSEDIEKRIQEHKSIPFRMKESINQKYPLYLAIKKYGIENFEFEIIEECKSEQLNDLEQFWIKELNTYINDDNSNGYNLTRGGDGHRTLSVEQIQNIINLWNQGYSVGEIVSKTSINNHAIIKYLKEYSDYTVEEGDRRGRINSGRSHRKAINVYDKYCQLIATFDSVKEAAEALDVDPIRIGKVLSKKNSICNNMFFIEKDKNQVVELIDCMKKQNTPAVIETDSTQTQILNIFFNKDEIRTYLSREQISSVQPCCKGHCSTAYGHYWTYLYKYIEQYGLDYSWIKRE